MPQLVQGAGNSGFACGHKRCNSWQDVRSEWKQLQFARCQVVILCFGACVDNTGAVCFEITKLCIQARVRSLKSCMVRAAFTESACLCSRT